MIFLISLLFSFQVMADQLPAMLNENLDSAGTAERLSTSDLYVRSFMVCGNWGNAGDIYIGSASAKATAALGIRLAAGACFSDEGDHAINGLKEKINLKEIWFDGSTTNDDVTVWYKI